MSKIVTKARQLRLRKQADEGRLISLQRAAKEAGIDRAALTRVELGHTSRIDFDTLIRLCEYYKVGVGDVLEYQPDGA